MRGWRRTAGVAPEVLYFDADGLMLTRFLDAEPVLAARLQDDDSAIERAARSLRRLHESGARFEGEFRPFESIAAYVAALDRYGAPLGVSERAIVARIEEIGAALALHPSRCKTLPLRSDRRATCSTTGSRSGWSTGNIPA